MQKLDLVTIRDAVIDDKAFIFSTFLRGLYYGESYFSQIPKDIFMSQYHRVLEHILGLPTVSVKVAALREDPEVILGYSILGGNGEIAHWVFVKSAWRKAGIGKSLIPDNLKAVTHLTSVGQSLLKKRPDVIFNPFNIQ